ncbi:recombinase RecT [Rhizosphaericola mali]|uniref:Recombinase RecT n=1 Tax=Rhizosphaericola mali TaxID=2545455 RepID=A0A5P2G0W7_9BACT|nr:RecT family recombinase [Rhizosphaericola mali]QES88827.1 recombinase RecT [Rhizosphaericola mali]
MSTQNNNSQVPTTTAAQPQIEVVKKDISSQVLSKIETFKSTGELNIPKDYSPENALKSAYITLAETSNKEGKYALEYCTKESIADSLLKMVIWGLSPLKKQCYFIMFGNRLQCTPDYSGNIALAKRYGKLKSIKALAIFKGDEFKFEVNPATGHKKVLEHKQTIESIGSNEVIGAYAITEMEDGTTDVEILSMKQIRASWEQGAAKGSSPAHNKFPDQMAIKTAINRACKLIIRSSDDSALMESVEDEAEQVTQFEADVNNEITEKSNKRPISINMDLSTIPEADEVSNDPEPLEAMQNEGELFPTEQRQARF